MSVVCLTPKEVEAIMWGLAQIGDRPDRDLDGPTDPLQILLDRGHPLAAIVETCSVFFEKLESHILSDPLTPLERNILELCVSNTSWLDSYDRAGLSVTMKTEATRTLRDLAYKLEAFDIEVPHIPS